MQQPIYPPFRISTNKYSKYLLKFALMNGSELAQFTIEIIGKPETEKFRKAGFAMIDEEAAQFVSLGQRSEVRQYPDEFIVYKLKIKEEHPDEKLWFRLCRDFRSRKSGRKMSVTYLIPIEIEDDGIHVKKMRKRVAVKVW